MAERRYPVRPDIMERQFLKRANEQIGGEMGSSRMALKSFAKSPVGDIHAGSHRQSEIAPEGFAADYQRMTNEFRRGSKIIREGRRSVLLSALVSAMKWTQSRSACGGVMLGGMAGRSR